MSNIGKTTRNPWETPKPSGDDGDGEADDGGDGDDGKHRPTLTLSNP